MDMLNWGVCVMKQYNSNFLACFCSTKVTSLSRCLNQTRTVNTMFCFCKCLFYTYHLREGCWTRGVSVSLNLSAFSMARCFNFIICIIIVTFIMIANFTITLPIIIIITSWISSPTWPYSMHIITIVIITIITFINSLIMIIITITIIIFIISNQQQHQSWS